MHISKKLINSHSTKLLLAIIIALFSHQLMPLMMKEFFLSFSLTMKEFLMFMIPLIIFSSVYKAFSKIRGNAFLFASLLLMAIIISNFFSVSIAGIFSYFILNGSQSTLNNLHDIDGLMPLWDFYIPKLVSNNFILLISLILACISIPKIEKPLTKIANLAEKIVDIFLKKLFIPLLPIFIFGFLIKLLHDDIIMDVLSVNPKAFLFMIFILFGYLAILLLAVNILYKKNMLEVLKNIIPPAVTAFTTMSSAASLPFSIKAAEFNTKNKNISDVVMPASANIHMVGDSICIPILAMILLIAFGQPIPTLSAYIIFAITFVITKFSGAGVPGGSILIMLPVLESCLHFTPEMSALITICYILLDPIATSGNVIGNNLFVIHFTKLYEYIAKKNN